MYLDALFVLTLVLFIGFLTIGILIYNKKNDHYSLYNHFPYELDRENKFPVSKFLYALFVAFLIVFQFVYLIIKPKNEYIEVLNYIFFIFLCLNDVLSFMLVSSRIKESLKTHISFMSFYFLTTLGVNLYAIFYLVRISYSSLYFLIYFILMSILTIILIILTFKANLKNDSENKRKKFISLAFFEWVFIFINISFNLVLLLMYYL